MKWLSDILCDWTHGGGTIERDEQGRINWRCRKCGRWSDNPVPLEEEREMTNRAIAARYADREAAQ